MKKIWTTLGLWCCLPILLLAQEKQGLQWGYSFGLDYNMYHWNKSSLGHSSGQILNVVPGLNTGLWLGRPESWLISLQGDINYSPFALDINGYKGLGTLALPVTVQADFPIKKTKGLAWVVGLCGGAQWTYTDLYARPSDRRGVEQLDQTYIGGLSTGLMVGWDSGAPLWLFDTYIRGGAGRLNTISIHWGLRLRYYGRFTKRKTITTY